MANSSSPAPDLLQMPLVQLCPSAELLQDSPDASAHLNPTGTPPAKTSVQCCQGQNLCAAWCRWLASPMNDARTALPSAVSKVCGGASMKRASLTPD